ERRQTPRLPGDKSAKRRFELRLEPTNEPLPWLLSRNIEGRPCGVGVDACSLRSDRHQGSKPASRRSARASLRVLDCVLAPAAVLSTGSWRSPFLSFAQFRCYEFSLVLEVMPPQKSRSVSPLLLNFLARIKERPCGVKFECCLNFLQSERSAPVE